MDYCLWQWLKEEPTVQTFVVGLTTGNRALCLPADPMRFAWSIPNGFASNLLLSIGDVGTTPTEFVVSGSADINIVTWEKIGGAVQFPVFGALSSTTTTLAFKTFSWNPQRYDVYRRCMSEYLSRYGAS